MFYRYSDINSLYCLNTRLPGNLSEIFTLRFRLREELRFLQAGQVLIAEKVKSGRRYSMKAWQHEMLMSFDGRTTFGAAAERIYLNRPGAFTAIGLLNFYNWLYTENLVICECDSIFEFAVADADSEKQGADEIHGERGLLGFASRLLGESRTRHGLAIAAALVFFLSVIRLVYVAAPVFEPPIDRLYAEVGQWFDEESPVATIAESRRAAADSAVEAIEFSALADETSSEASPVVPASPVPEPAFVKGVPLPPAEALSEAPSVSRIEVLRTEIEECRVRRDECYLQNDELGYRREVQRMMDLAREIGLIERER